MFHSDVRHKMTGVVDKADDKDTDHYDDKKIGCGMWVAAASDDNCYVELLSLLLGVVCFLCCPVL